MVRTVGHLIETVLSGLMRAFLAVLALVCVAMSCKLAYDFGVTKSPDPSSAQAAGIVMGCLDLFKSFILVTTASRGRKVFRLAILVVLLLSPISLMSAIGYQGHLKEQREFQITGAAGAKKNADREVQDLRDERGRLPKFTPTDAGAVDVAQRAVDLATKQKTDECDAKRGGRGKFCHDREEDERKAMDKLSAARADKALTDRDAELASKLGKAQDKADQIDMSAGITDADPMSSDIAAALDANPVRVAFWIYVLIAIAIEAVSCFGMHLCFHLGNHEQVRQPRKNARRDDLTADVITDAEVIEPAVIIGSPPADDVRERFFKESVNYSAGPRVKASDMHAHYSDWCQRRGLPAMTAQAFGLNAPWPKKRIGGSVWYLDARLATAGVPNLQVVVDNSPQRALGRMVSVGR